MDPSFPTAHKLRLDDGGACAEVALVFGVKWQSLTSFDGQTWFYLAQLDHLFNAVCLFFDESDRKVSTHSDATEVLSLDRSQTGPNLEIISPNP